jgi:hypothetical protein
LCWMFISSSTLCDTVHFSHDQSRWSYIPLQHHISKLSRYFWSNFRTVQVPALHKSTPQMWHPNRFILEFKPNLLVRRVFLFSAAVGMAVLDILFSWSPLFNSLTTMWPP